MSEIVFFTVLFAFKYQLIIFGYVIQIYNKFQKYKLVK
jgi:hypothetical protein